MPFELLDQAGSIVAVAVIAFALSAVLGTLLALFAASASPTRPASDE